MTLPVPADWRSQLQAHLQSLRAAGVEWLPLGPPLNFAPPPKPALVTPEQPTPDQTKLLPPPAPPLPVSPPSTLPLTIAEPNMSDVAELSLDQRRQELAQLAAKVAECRRCDALASTRTQTVFGQGEPGVELCFVGEAPGADEDAEGLPFVGAAGQLLNKILQACGIKREEVYICNILKCRPPGNRTPLPDEAANCRGFLERQLELVQPKYIVALGGCAATNLLGTTLSLKKLRGRFHDYRGIPVMVTYHPAYLLPHRHPESKRDVWDDMKWLLAKMGRTPPDKA